MFNWKLNNRVRAEAALIHAGFLSGWELMKRYHSSLVLDNRLQHGLACWMLYRRTIAPRKVLRGAKRCILDVKTIIDFTFLGQYSSNKKTCRVKMHHVTEVAHSWGFPGVCLHPNSRQWKEWWAAAVQATHNFTAVVHAVLKKRKLAKVSGSSRTFNLICRICSSQTEP